MGKVDHYLLDDDRTVERLVDGWEGRNELLARRNSSVHDQTDKFEQEKMAVREEG